LPIHSPLTFFSIFRRPPKAQQEAGSNDCRLPSILQYQHNDRNKQQRCVTARTHARSHKLARRLKHTTTTDDEEPYAKSKQYTVHPVLENLYQMVAPTHPVIHELMLGESIISRSNHD
jgi:hypothetical protein